MFTRRVRLAFKLERPRIGPSDQLGAVSVYGNAGCVVDMHVPRDKAFFEKVFLCYPIKPLSHYVNNDKESLINTYTQKLLFQNRHESITNAPWKGTILSDLRR